MSEEAEELAAAHGGNWSEHPDWLVASWQQEVSNGDTRRSYWDWVLAQVEE